ncbi:CopG family antitoxin [Bacillus cereus]|nr:CopG family antitoxin [Bacillus cereus]MDA2572662.1 CopG family antitoxin [Bacillus cereus]
MNDRLTVANELQIKKFTLSIPDTLLEEIKKEANQRGMSVNSYILMMVNKHFEEN